MKVINTKENAIQKIDREAGKLMLGYINWKGPKQLFSLRISIEDYLQEQVKSGLINDMRGLSVAEYQSSLVEVYFEILVDQWYCFAGVADEYDGTNSVFDPL